jgi:hypothetical protein
MSPISREELDMSLTLDYEARWVLGLFGAGRPRAYQSGFEVFTETAAWKMWTTRRKLHRATLT